VYAVLAGMNTEHFRRCFLKAERISYKKMPLIISGTPYKKSQKFTTFKMADFVKILEIRPISGQAICSFIAFHPEKCVAKEQKLPKYLLKKY
jgi:hypothetical protein